MLQQLVSITAALPSVAGSAEHKSPTKFIIPKSVYAIPRHRKLESVVLSEVRLYEPLYAPLLQA
jgi:hypothetical protein